MLVNNAFPSIPPPMAYVPQSTPSGIPGKVIVLEMYNNEENEWPGEFLFAPRRGDVVQAEDGRRLDVLNVVHTIIEGRPVCQIEVGADKNAVTATTGGGGPVGEPY